VRTVASYLSAISTRQTLLGNSALERAQVDQWLEYWQLQLETYLNDTTQVSGALKVRICHTSFSLYFNRAVKTFLSSRLIMNSRRLWNSHQRLKFLRARASRDILKFRVSEMAFAGIFQRNFPPWMPCCFVRIYARLGTMPSKCPRCSIASHDLNVSQI